MNILSFQPCSLYQNGGAGRVFRRLYQGKESEVYSLAVITGSTDARTGKIQEKLIIASPLQRTWMRWYLRSLVTWLRERVLTSLTIRKIRKAAAKEQYDVVNLISHGPFSKALCDDFLLKGKKLWVSFHDHFSTNGCSFDDTSLMWNRADRRLVISEELGYEYQKLFGKINFEVITDGVSAKEMSEPTDIDLNSTIDIYFAGLLHIDYYPLFKILADALDILTNEGLSFKLILRGTQVIEFLNDRAFIIDYRKDFISDKDIKKELDSAAILYLPIKFTLPDFYLYSMSTKMVGYLGASGSILYHGPGNSAVFNLLREFSSAIGCTTLEVNNMLYSIRQLITRGDLVSVNAKLLAKTKFDLDQIRQRFWEQS